MLHNDIHLRMFVDISLIMLATTFVCTLLQKHFHRASTCVLFH